jgi:hypothetical protein
MFTTKMPLRNVLTALVFFSVTALSQQKTTAPSPAPGVLDLPVTLQQNVTAGATVVGTKIKAKLIVATLVNGVVLPKNAVLSGEVTESKAKSGTDPSHLAIRMDSAEWKNGSAPIKVYLTGWYYPTKISAGQNLTYGPNDTSVSWKTWNGAGAYPDRNAPASQPFPGNDSDRNSGAVPNTPLEVTMDHRVLMKNVESAHNDDGSVVVSSSRSNIKLDKLTTYVFGTGELVSAPAK